MSRQPTVKTGEAPTQESDKPKAKLPSTPGVRPVVPGEKPVSRPPPAKVAAAKPATKSVSSPGMKPPPVAKPPPAVARVPQASPISPTQPQRPPPVMKPSMKASAPSPSAGPAVGTSQVQDAAPPSRISPAADQEQGLQLAVIWPCGVPGMEEASRLLGGQGSQGKHEGAIEGLWRTLTQVELGASLGPSPVDLSALKQAVIVRWRLRNALETKPAPGAAIETEALERLLKEADSALTGLQSPDGATEPVRAAFASARAALAKDAVTLSNIAAEFAQQAAAEAASNKATKKYANVARLVAASADTTKTAFRSKVLWAGLAVSVLGAAAFHGYRYLHDKDAPMKGPSYSTAGMHGFKDESSGIAVLHAIDPSKPIDPAVLAQLKAEAEANGKTVHEVEPGHYVIAPSKLRVAGNSPSQTPAAQQ